MKVTKQILGIIALGAMALTQTACQSDSDFLKEHSYKQDENGMYNTQGEIEGSINTCYRQMQYLLLGTNAGHSYMYWGVGLDTFAPNSSSGNNGSLAQFADWRQLNSASGWARHWNDNLFQLVNFANTAIDNINEKNIVYSTPTKKEELLGEARFFRGYAYRLLAGMYGNVPILAHHTTSIEMGYQPNTRREIWQFCYDDFKYAAEHMATTERAQGCVTRAAADHMLAEICLDLGKWDEAIEACSRVIGKQDGDYQLMTTRFGTSAGQTHDRYGHDLSAANGGAYWDLFRTPGDGSGNTNQDYGVTGNKEALWTSQFKYGNYVMGGSGMSWSKVRGINKLEAHFFNNGIREAGATRKLDNDEVVYLFTDDDACYPAGVAGLSTPGTSASAQRDGRFRANNMRDSLGGGYAFGGNLVYPCRYLWDKNAKGYLWAHSKQGSREDIRGSETMIQRDWYTPGGKRWSECLAKAIANSDEAKRTGVNKALILTGSDTISFFPRFWKFSTDKHPNGNTAEYEYEPYIIRIAETYLLRAEAYLAKGDRQKAADDINALRDRANAPRVAASDIDIDFILDERARELFGEECRMITLNRLSANLDENGQAYSYITEKYPIQDETTSNTLYERVRKYGFSYINESKESNEEKGRMWNEAEQRYVPNIKPYNYQYPIPDDVIKSNTGAEYPQNTGY